MLMPGSPRRPQGLSTSSDSWLREIDARPEDVLAALEMTERDSEKDLETRQIELRSRAIASRVRRQLAEDFKGVIAISGRAGAGKRPLGRALAEDLGFPHASFGDYVRGVAQQRQIKPTREALQKLGDELIRELGWDEFCRRVLEAARVTPGQGPVVVDGIRHEEARATLARMFAPEALHMIYVNTGRLDRYRRLRTEDGVNPLAAATKVDSHPTEQDARALLREEADDVVSGDDQRVARRDALRGLDRLTR
jgi:cytidylate kinase